MTTRKTTTTTITTTTTEEVTVPRAVLSPLRPAMTRKARIYGLDEELALSADEQDTAEELGLDCRTSTPSEIRRCIRRLQREADRQWGW